MTSIFYIRHQSGGVMHEYPFSSEPTEKQKAAINKLCAQRYGVVHSKTLEPYWTSVVKINVLGPEDEIDIADQKLSVSNVVGVEEFSVSAVGKVTPPKKR